jgi:hypothetical protein
MAGDRNAAVRHYRSAAGRTTSRPEQEYLLMQAAPAGRRDELIRPGLHGALAREEPTGPDRSRGLLGRPPCRYAGSWSVHSAVRVNMRSPSIETRAPSAVT